MLTAAQVRGARAMLGWTVVELAEASGANKNAIVKLERGGDTRYSTALLIEQALREAGVVFNEDGSVFHPKCVERMERQKQAMPKQLAQKQAA